MSNKQLLIQLPFCTSSYRIRLMAYGFSWRTLPISLPAFFRWRGIDSLPRIVGWTRDSGRTHRSHKAPFKSIDPIRCAAADRLHAGSDPKLFDNDSRLDQCNGIRTGSGMRVVANTKRHHPHIIHAELRPHGTGHSGKDAMRLHSHSP